MPGSAARSWALGLAALLAALALGEGALRLAQPARLAVVRYPCIYEPDPQLGFRYRPGAQGLVSAHFEIENRVEINSLGFYDDEPLPAGEAEWTLLGVGDSFTAAMNVARDEVWTAVLERELRARGRPRADVVNLGIDGTGTDVHVELIARYLPRFQPQVVVLAFFANDAQDVLAGRFERECYRGYVLSYQTPAQRTALRQQVDAYRARPLRRWLFEHSYWMRLLHLALDDSPGPERIEFLQPRAEELAVPPGQRQARVRELARSLRRLEQLSRDCSCRLMVAPVPPRRNPQASLERFRSLAAGLDLEVVDVLPAMRRLREADGRAHEDLYFEHDAHFNAYGNALYARALAELLSPD